MQRIARPLNRTFGFPEPQIDPVTRRLTAGNRRLANHRLRCTATPAQLALMHSVRSWCVEWSDAFHCLVVELETIDERQVTMAAVVF